jgi:hypothetical protein
MTENDPIGRLKLRIRILILISIMLLILILLMANHSKTIKNYCDAISNVQYNCSDYCSTPKDKIVIYLNKTIEDNITSIAEDFFNNHTYILYKYDCTQFSRDLVKLLKKEKLDAYCISGFTWVRNENNTIIKKSFHTWVEVNTSNKLIEVEATGGYIISEDEYKYEYVEITKRLCW